MHGLLRCNINAGVHARAVGVDVSLRDVTIAKMGNGATENGWRHAPEAHGGLGDFEKVIEWSWVQPREKTVGFSLLAEARPVAFVAGATRVGAGGRWKSQNRENVYLSPYVEESLNSKVIRFIPELRSRKCLSCFEIPMFYVYVIYMYISHRNAMSISHIRISSYRTHVACEFVLAS